MAELTTLARPYAKAAFNFAVEQTSLALWQQVLSAAASLSAQPTVDSVIQSPRMTAQEKSTFFVGLLIDALKKQLDQGQQNFFAMLAENKRLELLSAISELFDLYKANREKTVHVEVETAFELTSSNEQQLVEVLTKNLAREVTLKTSVNADLLGGVLVRAGDTVIDASARGGLQQLANVLQR